MPKFTIDIFEDAADRFEAAQAEVLKEWQPACGCDAPGLRPECRTCCDCYQLRVLTQMKLSPTPEKVFPAALPPESSYPHPPEVKERVLEMYAQGCPLSEIQAETGVGNRQTIRSWAREAGMPSRLVIHSNEVRERCLRFYQLGKKCSEIEHLTRVPADTIQGWAQNAGITRRPHYSAEIKAYCLSLYQQGSAPNNIESLTGVRVHTIQRWVRKAKLNRESGRPRKYSEAVRESCLLLKQEGKDYREIVVLTGVSEATVRGWVKKKLPPISQEAE